MLQIDNKAEIDRIYAQLSQRADLVYSFVTVYNSYINELRDYGTGMLINMVEVHTLTMIADHPGITVSELSVMWSRTKGAVSQNVTRLEKKGLITRQRDEKNAKIVHLYVTEEGERLSTAHKMYDNMDIMQTQRDLLQSCSLEEVDSFYKVLKAYLQLF
ncbi:MarR family winged helix-turn-helix transcriptional regulator [Harryflintia acetispora]|uniref:MarR family winged helix-turn-helix transcriptional regulator n=1 Tax=Harryflintia acetispora TaxID=1849041 RepID=UPI00189B9E5A|nr:MarR family transcriptional regulator [Harryflintia acetispora]